MKKRMIGSLALALALGLTAANNLSAAESAVVLKPAETVIWLGAEITNSDLPTTGDWQDLPDTAPISVGKSPTTAPSASKASTQPATSQPTTAPSTQPTWRPDLTVRQKRIIAALQADQKKFLVLMKDFLRIPFTAGDTDGSPLFVKTRKEIVDLVFKSEDEKIFYERLYLINMVWLEHQDQIERFNALHEALRDENLVREDHNNRIRKILSVASSVVGAGVGGFIGFKVSAKWFTLAPNEAAWSQIPKIAGRGLCIIAGASVGSALGGYAGFLGSDFLLRAQWDFIDPIDGDEDIRDVLDVINPY